MLIPAERHGGHTHAAARTAAAKHFRRRNPTSRKSSAVMMSPAIGIISLLNSQLPVGRPNSSLDKERPSSNHHERKARLNPQRVRGRGLGKTGGPMRS